MNHEKILLVVIDGWGLYKDYPGNAISQAKTPTFNALWKQHPRATLEASGLTVGLPDGQMGTSEVNHLTIGAGRVMPQNLVRINQAIEDGSFFHNQAFIDAFENVKEKGGKLHLMGLVSSGGVHSHQNHLFALLKSAKDAGLDDACVHVFTDGRDAPMHGSRECIPQLNKAITDTDIGRIVSIVGRYYAMDRDHNWERTDKAYNLLTKGEGEIASSPTDAIKASYKNEITDEYIEPIWLGSENDVIKEGDSVIFFNFRNDRPRQLTERFLKYGPEHMNFVTMTQYEPSYGLHIAYPQVEINQSLGQVLSEAGIKQLRVTETEKFAHMTFFINCKYEDPHEGEDRIMLDTHSDIKTHDEKPDMRAQDITTEIIQDMQAGTHQVIFTNICNPDIVGHTGNIKAAIKACETVDASLNRIIEIAKETGHHVIVTADHGNADEMLNEETGEPITSHSLNPVPFILISDTYQQLTKNTGTLIDIAPTILTMLNLSIPIEMTGISLV